MGERRRLFGLVLNILVPIVELALLFYAIPRLLRFFLPFVIGGALAMIAAPLVGFLERHFRLLRRHSSMVTAAAVLALVIGGLYLALGWVSGQAAEFVSALPELYQSVSLQLREIFLHYDHLFALLPDSLQHNLQQITGNIGEAAGLLVKQIASPTVEAAGNVARHIPDILVNSVVTLLSAYFFIADQEQAVGFFRTYIWRHLPRKWRQCCHFLREDGKRLIGGYFLAQAQIMLVVAAILIAGFLVLQVRYAFLLGILVAFLDFLPLFGTGTVLIPWGAFQLLTGNYALTLGLLLLYVLTQVLRQMIQPKIVGDTLGLSPLWTLFFLYVGFRWNGISGMIVAVPIGILILRLVEHGFFDEWVQDVKELAEMFMEFRKR